jgi:uncharacterized repeat protein (TIGR03803 family)
MSCISGDISHLQDGKFALPSLFISQLNLNYMNRSIPPCYLPEKVIRQSAMRLVWAVLLSVICLSISPAYSQDVVFGTTIGGGLGGFGTVFSLNSIGSDYTVRHAFSWDGYYPKGNLIEGKDGYLYGMAPQGKGLIIDGQYQTDLGADGVIFKIRADGTGYTILKSFNSNTDGAHPGGSLIIGSDGYLYGMTREGGVYDEGTIFKIRTDGTDFKVLYSFFLYTDGPILYTDGAGSDGSLFEGKDGYLYGKKSQGGPARGGVIFKIKADATDFTILHSFYREYGSYPYDGNLIEGTGGYLYGIAQADGGDDSGIIFKLNTDGTNFTVLHTFKKSSDVYTPQGNLTEGSDGYLYGIIQSSIVFKIAPDGTDFTLLHSFIPSRDYYSFYPHNNLTEGSDGYFYGMTRSGGDYDFGTVFKLASDGSDFMILKSFNKTDGASPYGGLIEGSDGYLYSMARKGGDNDSGIIFKINPDGTDFMLLHSFKNYPDAITPTGGLLQGSDGLFYGMTYGAGLNGTIYKLAPNGSGFTILHIFNKSTDGTYPHDELIEGIDGYLYGMASGGVNGGGTIFKINPDDTNFTVLHNFNSSSDGFGSYPQGSLIEGSDGNLYGMTSAGGDYGFGTVFKLASNGTGFMILKSFNKTDGDRPLGSLIESSDGYLYGMTPNGGDNDKGTIFKISTAGTGFTLLKSFNEFDGSYPQGSLIEGSDGYLYGVTAFGGVNSDGTIFKINPNGTNFTLLHSFYDSFYSFDRPIASLTEGSDGYFYGITANLIEYPGHGTIFKINANGSDFAILRSFNSSTDGDPPAGRLIVQKEKKPSSPALQVNFGDKHTKTPQGWVKDYGLAFGQKIFYQYGWKRRADGTLIDLSIGGSFPGSTGNGRWRPTPTDPLLATFLHMQGNDVTNFRGTPVESYWELSVENGDYQVSVSVGDGYRYTYSDLESHSLNVEGIPAITNFFPHGPSGSLTRFKQATIKVTVSDGLLTLDADGGTNTKINYAIIQPLSSSAAIARKDFSSQGEETQAQLRAYPNPFSDMLTLTTQLRGTLAVAVYDPMGKQYYQGTHLLQTGEVYLDLSAVNMKAGLYLIKLQAEDGSSQLIKVLKK